ncbi:uncharacterized protein PV09_09395 [Verruconis gallopava]|uniref:Uncharacterized protein n=1 Tax=Verruconis gallopava TaxID=253628 RepID=A0A0D1ZXR6_9PEZI|nr:uncharacterized protein PV09_09395 [Verruconis gallopava]KIV98869.1 hypothetical protein PV09_09395 [Verruconis gallopava]
MQFIAQAPDPPDELPVVDNLGSEESPPSNITIDICAINAAPFYQLLRKRNIEIFAVSLADVEKALADKKHTDPKTKLPLDY